MTPLAYTSWNENVHTLQSGGFYFGQLNLHEWPGHLIFLIVISLIPPSKLFIICGILTETSISRLFLAGILPGILSLIGFLLVIYLWVRHDPTSTPAFDGEITRADRIKAAIGAWPAIVEFVTVADLSRFYWKTQRCQQFVEAHVARMPNADVFVIRMAANIAIRNIRPTSATPHLVSRSRRQVFRTDYVYTELTNRVRVFPGIPQMDVLVMQYTNEKCFIWLANSQLRYVSSGGYISSAMVSMYTHLSLKQR